MRGWPVTGSRWTPTRRSWYGFVRNNNSTSFQSTSYLCCLPGWPSRQQFTTSVFFWISADHERSFIGSVSVLLLAAMSTPTRQVIAHVRHWIDTCTRLHQQPPWLLQQLAVQCQWRLAEEATSRSERSGSGGDGSKKVRAHHAGASWTSLASSPSENPVQAGDDSLQVSTRIGADVPGGRLRGNLCYCRQATSAVHWHRVTVRTKDKYHAGDEEFRGRRSSHLEQFTSRPA